MANLSILSVAALIMEILGCIFTIIAISTSYWGKLDRTFTESGGVQQYISGHWGMFEICRDAETDNFISSSCESTSSGVSDDWTYTKVFEILALLSSLLVIPVWMLWITYANILDIFPWSIWLRAITIGLLYFTAVCHGVAVILWSLHEISPYRLREIKFETGWSWSIAVVCLIWELLAVIPVVFSRLSDEYGYDDMFWVYPPDFVLRAEKKNIFYKFCASFCLRLRFNHGEPKEEEPLVSECARSMPELVDRRAQSTSFEFAAHPDLELNDAQPDVNDAKEIEESQGMGDKYKILPDAEKCDEVVEPEEKEECDGDFEEVLLVHKPDEVEEENKEEDERKSLFEEKEALETGSVDLTDTKDLYPPESPHDLKEPTESPRDLHEDPQEVAPSENEFEEHVMETANDYNDEREDDPFVDEPEIVTEENDAASVKSGNDLDEDNDPVYESDFEDEDPDDDIEAKNEPEPEEPEPELTFTFEPSNSFKGKKGKVVKKKGKGIKRKGSKKKKKVRRSTSGAQQPEIAKKKPRAKTAKTPSEVKRNSKPDVSEPFTLTVKPASYFWQRITRSIVNDFRQSRKNAALENPDGMDVQDHDDRLFDRPARYNVPNNEQDDDDNGASARQRSKTMPDIHVDMTDGDTEGAAGVDYDALMYETYHDEQDLAPKHAEAVDVSDEKQGTGSGYRPRKLKPAWTNLLDSFKSQAVNAELSKPGNKAQTKAYSKKKQTQQLPVPNEERERKISIFSTGSSIPAIDI